MKLYANAGKNKGKKFYTHWTDSSLLSGLAETAADFLFPWGTYCVCCGNYIDRGRSYCLCDHCVSHISWENAEISAGKQETEQETEQEAEQEARLFAGGNFPLDSIRCCMHYGLYERRLIFELKYNGNTYMARILARMLCDRLLYDRGAAEVLRSDYILPVPLYKKKEKKRGFNQAEKIARYFGRFAGIPVLPEGLLRVKETIPQRSVAGTERFSNLEGAFRGGADLEKKIRGKQVILLDDIFTTGATACHCGIILKEAGASKIHFLAIASANRAIDGENQA